MKNHWSPRKELPSGNATSELSFIYTRTELPSYHNTSKLTPRELGEVDVGVNVAMEFAQNALVHPSIRDSFNLNLPNST